MAIGSRPYRGTGALQTAAAGESETVQVRVRTLARPDRLRARARRQAMAGLRFAVRSTSRCAGTSRPSPPPRAASDACRGSVSACRPTSASGNRRLRTAFGAPREPPRQNHVRHGFSELVRPPRLAFRLRRAGPPRRPRRTGTRRPDGSAESAPTRLRAQGPRGGRRQPARRGPRASP